MILKEPGAYLAMLDPQCKACSIESLFIISNDTDNEITYTPFEPDNDDSISSDCIKLVTMKNKEIYK